MDEINCINDVKIIIIKYVVLPFSNFQDWFCKTIIVLSQYTMVSNILWMFVEGLFLHNSIVVTVFSTDAPYKLFCAIGWGK